LAQGTTTQLPPAVTAAAAVAPDVPTGAESPDTTSALAQPQVQSPAADPVADVPRSPLRRLANSIAAHTASIAHMLTQVAMRFIGVPYVFGGTSTRGFDCSGYVQAVYAQAGIHLPRTADAQYYAARPLGGDEPKTGDLVFFQTYLPGPSHVGIYLGNGKFAQASSSHGVTVSELSQSYWRARFLGFRRVIPST
jgi:cell wall-associated NlpC family hydrolase